MIDPTHLSAFDLIPIDALFPLLWIADERHGFDEVPFVRHAIRGVVTGLVLGAVAVAMGIVPRALGSSLPTAAAALIGITTVLGVVAAIGSALFFRLVAQRQTPAVAGDQT